MMARSGIGVASYINSMNKDRRRKSSAPLLRSPYELIGNVSPAESISSNESVGLVMDDKASEPLSTPNLSSIFHFQTATPVNLNPISPSVKDEKEKPSFVALNIADDEKPTLKNRKLRKTKSFDDQTSGVTPQRKNGDRHVLLEMRNASAKATPINDEPVCGDSLVIVRSSPELIKKEELGKTPKKKFAVKKTGSKARLIGESPQNGSDDSLSKVVGKLKDKEVFL